MKIRENCQFNDKSDKAKNWHEDYKRLRQMQNHSSEVQEYFQTLWNQNGNNIMKSSYKTVLTTIVNKAGLTQAGAQANAQKAMQQAAKKQGQPQGSQQPQK